MPRPGISVYIPCHRYGRYLKQAVESVLAQSRSDWELIIVDDGSEDETAAVAADYRARFPDRIRVFRNTKAQGLQVSANVAIEAARGDCILRLDADDFLDENALLVLGNYLDRHPDVALVYPNYIYVDEKGNHLGMEQRKRIGQEASLLDLPAHGAGSLIRKRVLKSLGGYDPQYKTQDGYELWLNLLHRYGVANVATPLFFYRQHPVSSSRDEGRLLDTRRRIKRDLVKRRQGAVGLRVAAIVTAKNSYAALPNIALREVAGTPLIDYTLEAARGVKQIEGILVTTDDPRVVEHCQRIPGIFSMLRPASLSSDRALEGEVAENAVRWLEQEQGIHPDVVVLLNIHAPLRRSEHIQEAIDTLILYNVDSVLSVYENYELQFVHGKNGLIPLNPAMHRQIRLEREALFVNNGAVRVLWRDLLRAQEVCGRKAGHMVMSREDSFQIKTPFDAWLIEQILLQRSSSLEVPISTSTVPMRGPW